MSGKSPGTKRRRLEAPASSPDAQTGAAVATAKATAKRVLEIEDSSDSYVSPFVASPLRHISIPGARSVTAATANIGGCYAGKRRRGCLCQENQDFHR
jgi:hypothetical protein